MDEAQNFGYFNFIQTIHKAVEKNNKILKAFITEWEPGVPGLNSGIDHKLYLSAHTPST